MTSIQRIVCKTIMRHGMLHPGDRVGLAISGGGDSVALLRLFEELRERLGIALCVLHFNHRLRGKESDADEVFVKSLAEQARLPFIMRSADVAKIAGQQGWNLEDAARRLRYEFFLEVVSKGATDRVATAHTADDQAETVLARIIRGTGLAGLAAIHPVRSEVIRPLIDIRRADLRAYLAACGQSWSEDATNQDARRLRARVRHQLIPALSKSFSQSITERLCDLAALARDDEAFWSALVEQRLREIVSQTAKGFVVDANELLLPMPYLGSEKSTTWGAGHALAQRLVRRLYADTSGKEGQLSRTHVEAVLRLAHSGSSGRRLELPGGVMVAREFNQLIFIKDKDGVPALTQDGGKHNHSLPSYSYEISLSDAGLADVCIPELGRSFRLKVIDWPSAQRETRREGVVLDAERLRSPLILRSWKPGDAYRPSGDRQEKKLVRMLMSARIAVAERALWPVLTSAGSVAWADRMPAAAEFSAADQTRTGLWITENVH